MEIRELHLYTIALNSAALIYCMSHDKAINTELFALARAEPAELCSVYSMPTRLSARGFIYIGTCWYSCLCGNTHTHYLYMRSARI